MASAYYNSFRGRLAGDTAQISTAINLATDTIKLALVTSSYTPNIDNDNFWDDVSANEVGASGSYSAGGATLTVTGSTDNINDKGVFDATDVSFTSATITARYAVIYKSTGTASTSPLIAYIDFGSNVISTGGTFSILFSSQGILNL